MGSQMKPRHICLDSANPLADTFGSSETEQAAACLVFAMPPDSWEAVTPSAVKIIAGEPPRRWLNNPVWRPDIDRLIAGGFAERIGCELPSRASPIRFTTEGLKALRLSRWNTCTVTVCSECLRASCWQGKLYCEDYVGAFCTEKTPWELKALHTSQLEDPSYWDICDQCGTACGGKCDG